MTVEVWWSTLTAAGHRLLGLLDATERARVDSFTRPADRGRSLLGAALLRVAVASHLGIDPAEVVVDRTCAECGGPHGAPRILHPGTPGPWVSISHSGLLVVVALSPLGPVGVDVQRIEDLPDPAMGPGWVRREALLKARVATPEQTAPDTQPTEPPAGGTVRELKAPLDGYVAALATRTETDLEYQVRVRDPVRDGVPWSSWFSP
jgi:4'-phosphopantetheinyl transferase